MSQSRLATALTDGGLELPEGAIALLRPNADYDLSALDGRDVTIVHSFRPDLDRFEALGVTTAQDLPRVAVAIVVVPRAKGLARALLAEAAAKADLVIVDGQKTDGVDSLWTECRKRLGTLPSITKAHGRLFWFAASDAFADWAAPAPSRAEHGFVTTAGVYSEGAIDRGSALLAELLPKKLPGRMADFGAGWGYLAAAALTRAGVDTIDLIEAEALSLDCARQNITDPRANFIWADVTTFKPKALYAGIVMNPPFHNGRAADPSLGRSFIAAAAAALTPSGHLWMVANRHLPYEATLRETFRDVVELGGDGGFKIFHASRPLRKK